MPSIMVCGRRTTLQGPLGQAVLWQAGMLFTKAPALDCTAPGLAENVEGIEREHCFNASMAQRKSVTADPSLPPFAADFSTQSLQHGKTG